MPLPNPKVLEAFIQLYLNSRQKGRKPSNVLDSTLASMNNAIHYLAGKPSDDIMLQTCQGLINKFQHKESAAKWIEVTLDVCDTAKQAQESKTSVLAKAGLTMPESLLCETLYAIRSYILFHLQTDPALAVTYHAYTRRLITELTALEEKIIETREEYNDVTKLNEKRKELVIKLAYLDHRASIHKAIDLGCLAYLPQFNNASENMPYCYLQKFFLRLYSDKYQPETRISFEEFERKAVEGQAPTLPNPPVATSPVNTHAGFFTPLPDPRLSQSGGGSSSPLRHVNPSASSSESAEEAIAEGGSQQVPVFTSPTRSHSAQASGE